jgi:hypothetical protein
MRNSFITLLLLVCCFLNGYSQDMLGTWGSNYGGVSSAIQNPAFIANSKLYADINLVGFAFGYNYNDSYLEEPDSYVYEGLHLHKIHLPVQSSITNYSMANRPDFDRAFIGGRELGPAFMINVGRNAFALSFSVREAVSFTGIPDVVAKFTKQGFADSSMIANAPYNVNQPMRVAGLAWTETAFTWARVLKSDDQNVITLGATVKYLAAFGGGYASIDNINFTMQNRDQLTINNSNVSTGLSLPYRFNNSLNRVAYDPNYKWGKGFGTDIGFTIQHNTGQHYTQRFSRLCEQEFEQYDYRFSVSLLDLGWVTFKDNAISGTLVNTLPIHFDLRNFVFTSTQDVIDSLNLHYHPNPKDSSLLKQKFTIVTPTALSFQYDKRYTDHIYVTAAGVIGIPVSKNAIRRPSELAIIPRYESDIFEVSLPLSLYDFAKPRVGLSARIFFLTMGTDRLISLSGKHDYYGYDFYASIRLNFLKLFRMNYIKGDCQESASHPCF